MTFLSNFVTHMQHIVTRRDFVTSVSSMLYSKLWCSPRPNACKNITEEKWLLRYFLCFRVFWNKANITNFYFSKLVSQNTSWCKLKSIKYTWPCLIVTYKFQIQHSQHSFYQFAPQENELSYSGLIVVYEVLYICFYVFIPENSLSLASFVIGITTMGFESEMVTTCGKNKFKTNFFQNFSRIFKSVSITGFKTLYTPFTCS